MCSSDLLKQANLEPQYRKERDANAAFASFWSIASLWTESCRYDQKSEADARALYDAITKYMAANQGRAAKNIHELVAKGYLKPLPPLPPGKHYDLDQRSAILRIVD